MVVEGQMSEYKCRDGGVGNCVVLEMPPRAN